jgi:hypothetical protein
LQAVLIPARYEKKPIDSDGKELDDEDQRNHFRNTILSAGFCRIKTRIRRKKTMMPGTNKKETGPAGGTERIYLKFNGLNTRALRFEVLPE